MDEQSPPVEPQDGHGTEDTGESAAEAHGAGVPAAEQSGKQRPAYLDPRGSESTRELRDTARRRRDAEEKLQQHLMEAKHHVPNEFHEHQGHEHQGHQDEGNERPGPGQPPRPGQAPRGTDGSAEAEETGAGQAGREDS
ncbi:hypothetical protein [Arthrobacter sp. B1I2]|uniref:hypothetical protein n=1 Tax=Arthrobacter sp. B1I2 TaxID=3042263 RepID=UPI00278446D5|nr:hypothetical protein [Arthrobacter sp. B1I2]MDQ0729725.1 hypothetical protein [Arthrobacter sp. B1I2]